MHYYRFKNNSEEGRIKREETTYTCHWFHVDIWQKPTQYCKAIIFQLKINEFKFKKILRGHHRLTQTPNRETGPAVGTLRSPWPKTTEAWGLCVQQWLTLCDPMDCSPPGWLLCPWEFPSKNTGVCCHLLHQRTFLMQGLSLSLLYVLLCRWCLYPLSPEGWVGIKWANRGWEVNGIDLHRLTRIDW